MPFYMIDHLNFGKNLTIAQVSTPAPTPAHRQNYPIELYGSLGLLAAGILAVASSELKRLDRRREIEAKQAEAYVDELKAENSRLEVELRSFRNTVLGLRVRLAASEKEIEISSGELRRREALRE